MAIERVTGGEKRKTIEELFCTAELTGEVPNQFIFLSVLHIFLSITAFLGNALILIALHNDSSLHPPSKLLYRNLATTDLCVGIIADPLAVTRFVATMNKQWNICRYIFDSDLIISYILCSVSLLTMTAISVDRLLALLLGLRYRQVVTLKRTYLTVTVIWVASSVSAIMYTWNPLITLWYGNIGTSLCLVISILSYTKIVLTLRHLNQIQVQENISQGQPNQAIPLNIARYRKAVSSALWVQVTLVVCYLPYSIAVAFTPQRELPLSVYVAREFTPALIYLNSSLNPLIYCWKIREVRQAVKDTVRQICCFTS